MSRPVRSGYVPPSSRASDPALYLACSVVEVALSVLRFTLPIFCFAPLTHVVGIGTDLPKRHESILSSISKNTLGELLSQDRF